MTTGTHRGIRAVARAVACALVLCAAAEVRADRTWEAGGAVGIHTFSLDSELGVWDVPWASSPADSVFLGIHGSLGFLTRLGARVLFPPSNASLLATTDIEAFVDAYIAFPGAHEQVVRPPAPGDSDGDGLVDTIDTCPNEAEDKDGFEDEDGCPDAIPRQVKRYTGVIKGISFNVDSDIIRQPSYRILDAAARLLKKYPSLRVEISGHTDNTGDDDHNRDLSRRRAESVKSYLIDEGVDESRLQAVGYGPDRPLADNKKKRGRAKNRRVEFKLISELVP